MIGGDVLTTSRQDCSCPVIVVVRRRHHGLANLFTEDETAISPLAV
jgi:hypothetical protein